MNRAGPISMDDLVEEVWANGNSVQLLLQSKLDELNRLKVKPFTHERQATITNLEADDSSAPAPQLPRRTGRARITTGGNAKATAEDHEARNAKLATDGISSRTRSQMLARRNYLAQDSVA
jgi:hypothetical protein